MVYLTNAVNTFYLRLYGRKEGNVLFNERTQHILVTVIWKEGMQMVYLTMHWTHFSYGYMEGRNEMVYLTMHWTHFSYGYMEGRKEWNGLFNERTQHILFTFIWKEGRKCFI